MFYVSTGSLTRMYTLRHQYQQFIVVDGIQYQVTRDEYIRNLSIDKDKAVEVAKMLGYEVSTPEFTLEEIQRNTSEAAQLKIEQLREREAAERISRDAGYIETIKTGRFPFGKYSGYEFGYVANNNIDYIAYWMKSDDDSDHVILFLRDVLRNQLPEVYN